MDDAQFFNNFEQYMEITNMKIIPSDFVLAPLPPKADLESRLVLKRLIEANRVLANLNGFSKTIPNQYILINTLSLQEAKDSSEIENIITTHDELYRAGLFVNEKESPQAKEVRDYANALSRGFELIQKGEMLTINNICSIQKILERNDAGIRTQSGTVLQNAVTGETVYTPPQDFRQIMTLLGNLEQVINDDDFWPGVDPLVKMAAIHYQFESIHPFYDGNGRTGRIINVLYLVLKGLLDTPTLYLSRYIICHKSEYYRLLRGISITGEWEPFVLFMLDAVIETAQMTLGTIKAIAQTMYETKQKIKTFNFYSRDLIDALFLFPYTRIKHFQEQLGISRNTATQRLNTLVEMGILDKVEIGRNKYFVNKALFEILTTIPGTIQEETETILTSNR